MTAGHLAVAAAGVEAHPAARQMAADSLEAPASWGTLSQKTTSKGRSYTPAMKSESKERAPPGAKVFFR